MSSRSSVLSRDILSYWFQGLKKNQAAPAELMQLWFNGGPAVDEYISSHFKTAVQDICAGEHDELTHTPEGLLSMIVALDQFPRNIYRNTAQMFAYDTKALQLAKLALEKRWDQQVLPVQRGFLYLPFEHSEDLADQDTSVQLYQKLLKSLTATSPEFGMARGWQQYAQEHRDIIEQFGRFPHRNRLFNRPNTAEEKVYLESMGGSMFVVEVVKDE